ncbi:MAG: Dna2/Cas4 domain-containing protein [Cryomorphaceae bacterium]|nr:Dna2/Cas4 domain-containing protein [Cryomorphaceae bacterium]
MIANSEYSDLLSYLNEHVPIPKVKVSKKEVKIQNAKIETKRLLEESSEIFSDVSWKVNSNSSKGFNVNVFESLMRSKLIDDYKKLESYERPYVSVSELYKCIRQNYYTRMRVPIDIKKQFNYAYLYLIQKIGNEVHDIIQNLYNFTETEKTIVSQNYKVKGRIDAIKDGFVYELKTIDPSKFKGKYFKEHYYQGLIYSHILNNEYNYNIDTIVIVYITRDLKKIVPIDLPIDDSVAKSFLDRAPILLSSLAGKTPPDPIGSTSEQCKWCLYKEYCKKDSTSMTQPFLKTKKVKSKPKVKVKSKPSKKRESAFLL